MNNDDGAQIPRKTLDSLELAHIALEAALDTKALEPELLEVEELCSYASHILLLSGRSDRQVDAIGESIKIALREQGYTAVGVEGKASGQWALLDYGDLIIHIFHHPIREHYDLESLWRDAVRLEIDVPDEARISAEDGY
ncbi:MAG: ribosome silencing factor [Myxococcales bacterium]|nr:ribosome silencing factor [Myxococcales bacterium]